TQQTPTLTVVKSSTTTSITAAGQVVTYTYALSNVGNVTSNNIALSDNNVDATPSCPSSSLAPHTGMTCTAQHTVTQPELDSATVKVTNVVTATSTNALPLHDALPISTQQTPTLTVVKSSTTTSITAAGQVVTYT